MAVILYLVLVVSTLIQLYYWLCIFRKLRFAIGEEQLVMDSPLPVSVIICAKNERDNLESFLPHILEQKYTGDFEVCVIDDASTDDTYALLSQWKVRYSHLRVLHLSCQDRSMAGKKYALSQGIAFATYDQLLLTDADCKPASDRWLSSMMAHLQSHDLVLGISPYLYRPGWLNRFIRYEAVWTAIQYTAFAVASMPYMGVGRNLLYRRSAYQSVSGFESHASLPSGDDDLLVSAVARPDNTIVNFQRDSFVNSIPKTTWLTYLRQKQRHVSTARYYLPKHKYHLLMLTTSFIFHYICIILVIVHFTKCGLIIAISCYVLRFIFISKTFYIVSKHLQSPDLPGWLPLLEFMQLCYYCILFPFTFLKQKTNWT